jgi:hypothetical protein
MPAQGVQQRRVGIDRTDGFDLVGKGKRVNVLRFGIQPIPAAMRFELGLSLRSARPNGLKWWAQAGV